ncbi:membrane fusion protein (multidrug efflux system) [Geothermobacter ehrlichii]|uniref:Membrane fusion protein (Multidrug efflux system) n=1 Tax=Geothermobacter ehrlichii TaxID=213224 RepID=A0A5D3WNU1_9BACT|nr:HlyD family secretion protein [Geothermobacter ehrlichii]TYP00004.1 membrane fusion protein (multidrug efflux system) [Geothermobacter ehrlichii]
MSSEKNGKRPVNKRKLATVILLLLIVVLAVGLVRFVSHRLAYAVTNAVFVASDSLTEVGFDRVGGVLAELTVREGETVHKGQILARLDTDRYRIEVEKAEAALRKAKEKKAGLKLGYRRLSRELPLATAQAEQEIRRVRQEKEALAARIAALQARIDQLRRDRDRVLRLFEQQVVPRQRLEKLTAELDAASAEQDALVRRRQALEAALEAARLQRTLAATRQDQLLELQKNLAAAQAEVDRLQASLDKARKDLASTTLTSPIDGRVAKKFVSAGASVAPGRPVLALVDPADLYIIALLEENKLDGVGSGAEAIIRIDAFPGRSWRGTVEQVLPASAATFALAPRDISAGEFTKVSQRIPVRIRIDEGDLAPLRVGLGGEVEIRRKKS